MSSYLGQNFLKDLDVIDFISFSINSFYIDSKATSLIEIGPGKGALTKKILNFSNNFFVIEKDFSMKSYLSSIGLKKENVIFDDILLIDLDNILNPHSLELSKALIVGNLPYYITSPILRKFFGGDKSSAVGGIFMIQNEVGLKLISDAKKKSYLWRLINWGYHVEYLKMIPPSCFSPAPKVKSCLIKVKKKEKPEQISFGILKNFLDQYVSFSRKTLGKISKLLSSKGEEAYFIPESYRKNRLEELSWDTLSIILEKYVQ